MGYPVNECRPSQQRGIVQFTVPETRDITGLGSALGPAGSAGVAFAFYFHKGVIDYVVPVPGDPGAGVIGGTGDINHAA